MRFLMTYHGEDRGPPSPEKIAALGKFSEEMAKSGVLLDTGGIMPLSTGGEVKQTGGKFTVTDGPYPETKELIVGYAIVQVSSRQEALDIARRFMAVAGDGVGEIRQLLGPTDEPPH
ncbi:MAG TPA: YciI family protein [Kofleriaceae bacterium]|nr:YciI family protein [Kofleriaceae bacterium]